MGRLGDSLERWGEENIKGSLTVNSGATHEDADLHVDNILTGKRIYEMKSSTINKGITINRVHARQLLQRAIKLSREPVFIYQNAKNHIVAIMPLRIIADKFHYPHNQTSKMKRILNFLEQTPRIVLKGDNIRMKEDHLDLIIDLEVPAIIETKNTIPWVIIDAVIWLELSDDRRVLKRIATELQPEERDDD